jgi:HSP20 family protein
MAIVERRHHEHPQKTGFWNELMSPELHWPNFFNKGKELFPAVNIKETENSFILELGAPGYEKEDFKIEVENGLLSIQAEKKQETKEEKDNYSRKEFSYQSFQRSFNLSEQIDEEDIKANYKNGILYIELGKLSQEELKEKRSIDIV